MELQHKEDTQHIITSKIIVFKVCLFLIVLDKRQKVKIKIDFNGSLSVVWTCDGMMIFSMIFIDLYLFGIPFKKKHHDLKSRRGLK